jgi:hypothetical protein
VATSDARLVASFATSDDSLRVAFSGAIDLQTVSTPENYSTRSGLKVLAAEILPRPNEGDCDDDALTRVALRTEPMNGHLMDVDVVRVEGVRRLDGGHLAEVESRPFLQGIASIPQTQKPRTSKFPFASHFEGIVATESCQKDGGVNSSHLIDALGFCFIHVERGGPFNSLKVVGRKHVPGIEEEVKRLAPRGLSPHVLWSGGEIQTIDGETRLVDTGFMEGSILPATPKEFPPPHRVTTNELSKRNGRTLRAKRFQGVIVRFHEIVLSHVSEPASYRADVPGPPVRRFRFRDHSGGELDAIALDTVTRPLRESQRFESIRSIVHQPRAGFYEAIVELNNHFVE